MLNFLGKHTSLPLLPDPHCTSGCVCVQSMAVVVLVFNFDIQLTFDSWYSHKHEI